MAKPKTIFSCRECGHNATRWLGRCPACGEWDTFDEERATAEPSRRSLATKETRNRPVPLPEVEADDNARLTTGVDDLDRILGGGLVPGSAVLIGGEPGIGKSTLLLQVAHWLAKAGAKVLYVTAEESAMQVRLRAERLHCVEETLLALAENNLDAILESAEQCDCQALVIDSIQMVHWSELSSAPGSVGQVRECAAALIAQAKRRGVPVFLVGHVTKDGAIAGPKVLEHMVDVVLNFEGDRFHAARVLRAAKNRFGAVNEIGVFSMGSDGLRPVPDPSALFLSGRSTGTPGTVVTAPLEGSRPFLVEAQALVTGGAPGNPRRRVSGVDQSRAAMLLAVLEKRCGLHLGDQDVFLNVVGGAAIREPGGDLALALAVAGSFREACLPAQAIALGEIGLGGEVRPVSQLPARLREAARLGFRDAYVPAGENLPTIEGLMLHPIRQLEDALEALQR